MSAVPTVGLGAVLLDGAKMASQVREAVTFATVDLTLDGAPTFTLGLEDPHRSLLKSGIFGSRLTTQVDEWSFELAQVRKTGPGIELTFEALEVAALRRHTTPLVVAPGTTTRLDFIKRLVAEEPWIGFFGPFGYRPETAKVELARGKTATADAEEEDEDTWTATGRLADEVGWRRFVPKPKTFLYLPETFIFSGDPEYVLEEGKAGVDVIDFDFDSGKPVATATATVRTANWQVPTGTVVELRGCGPADGKWLVSSISKSLFTVTTTIGLSQPRPVLPEPDPPPAPTAADLGPDEGKTAPTTADPFGNDPPTVKPGAQTNTGGTSEAGYMWPVSGTISSPFGYRGGRLHAGIDIAVPTGTQVHASRDGTVTHAGAASGYGIAVYINHGDAITRYGHLQKVLCRRGQQVSRGDVIALSDNTGHSTGPHLHFEIRPGDKPSDPMKYLPDTYVRRQGRPF